MLCGEERRGGPGMRRVHELPADGVESRPCSGRFTIPPEGPFGGEDGGAALTLATRVCTRGQAAAFLLTRQRPPHSVRNAYRTDAS